MRIAIIGTLWLRTPPGKYGGTEEVVFNLTNELVNRGHDVTFFGPANAKVKARIVTTLDRPIRDMGIDWNDERAMLYHLRHITKAFDKRKEFDIIHMHLNKDHDYVSLPLAAQSETPWITTCHFLLPSKTHRIDRYDLLTKYGELPYTSISDSQRSDLPMNFVATVYNSLAINEFPFSPEADDYFAWLGRVKFDKGTKEAILAAKKAHAKLYLMGAVDESDPDMLAYYENEVKPLVDGKQIIWLGEADLNMKVRYLSRAKAMLNPIHWREPFGLVMVEAQAVGTPVISFANGAAVELIDSGKTGYLVHNIDEMAKRMHEIDNIDRAACRKNVEDHYLIHHMVTGYEKAYEKVITHWPEYFKKQQQLLKKQD